MSDTFQTADTAERQATGGFFAPPPGGWGDFGSAVAQQLGLTDYTSFYDYFDAWSRYRFTQEDGDLIKAWANVYGEPWLQWFFAAEQLGFSDAQFEKKIVEEGYDVNLVAQEYKRLTASNGPSGGATKAEQYAAAEAAIRNQAGTLGYAAFSDQDIKALAKTVVQGNWSSDQLTDYLVKGATSDWSKLGGGLLTATVDAVKSAAAQQLISISDATAQQWAARVASGELDSNGLRSLIQAQAAGRYTWAKDVLDTGITMSDYLAPARDRIAQELELNPTEMSMLDPKFMSMVTVKDEKDGFRMATDAELIRAARKDSRWSSTNNASEMAAQMAMMLRQYVQGS